MRYTIQKYSSGFDIQKSFKNERLFFKPNIGIRKQSFELVYFFCRGNFFFEKFEEKNFKFFQPIGNNTPKPPLSDDQDEIVNFFRKFFLEKLQDGLLGINVSYSKVVKSKKSWEIEFIIELLWFYVVDAGLVDSWNNLREILDE